MMYNDDPELLQTWTKIKHSKGVLLLDKSQGFWLIHSVPRFPPVPVKGYGYPSSGRLYGQTAICVTYKFKQFIEIGAQLLYYNSNVYSCSFPDAFLPELSDLHVLCKGSQQHLTSNRRLTKLESAQGEKFVSFAKSQYFVDDIYAAWVAQALNTDLLAETWQRKGYCLPSNCSLPKHVNNIIRVKLPESVFFYSYHDHSKWCVSHSYEDQWTCLGDMNRAPQQAKCSGGLICTQNQYIYKAFREAVSWYKSCNHPPPTTTTTTTTRGTEVRNPLAQCEKDLQLH
nr:PREDICTED: deoxyribonuclease-2-beta-like [Latimeria chalumnae]|eukprot:XP_006014337.2 PREDICTED: deoxyribonuclease-2-beta-like [Latimeria chalumnae]